MRRIGGLGTLLAVVCVLCAVFASGAMAETEAQEIERGRELGIKAYIYGQPLLDTERIFKTSTSVTVATEDRLRAHQPALALQAPRHHQRERRRSAQRRHALRRSAGSN